MVMARAFGSISAQRNVFGFSTIVNYAQIWTAKLHNQYFIVLSNPIK